MNLLALVESPGHVCCRYRIAAFEPSLKELGIQVHYESVASSPWVRLQQMRSARNYDAVILQRKLIDALSLAVLRKSARHLVFDFDDAVVYRDSYSSKGHYDMKRAARFRQIVTQADLVLAGNSFLAQIAEEHGAKAPSIHYMPTCIDLAAYDRIRLQADALLNEDLVMVWIGSSSTLKGLEATSRLWDRIGRYVPDAVLKVVCDRFPAFENLRVQPVSWSEATEIQEIVTSHVGISHVPDDLWSRGKCGLKVLQYMAGGLPVLTNPVGVHGEMVRSGVSGFLLNRPGEWVEAVHWLSENPESARAMGREGLEAVRSGYDTATWWAFFADRVMPGSLPLEWSHEMVFGEKGSQLETSHGRLTSESGRSWKIESDSAMPEPHRDPKRSLRR